MILRIGTFQGWHHGSENLIQIFLTDSSIYLFIRMTLYRDDTKVRMQLYDRNVPRNPSDELFLFSSNRSTLLGSNLHGWMNQPSQLSRRRYDGTGTATDYNSCIEIGRLVLHNRVTASIVGIENEVQPNGDWLPTSSGSRAAILDRKTQKI
jgi:hypothetical protein